MLAEATKKIFASVNGESHVFTIEEDGSDGVGSVETNLGNDGNIPVWAQMLEPVRKLPTNVGTRIRKCVYEALDKDPPEWAKKILLYSISKEVYKGNASGPTKVLFSVTCYVINHWFCLVESSIRKWKFHCDCMQQLACFTCNVL